MKSPTGLTGLRRRAGGYDGKFASFSCLLIDQAVQLIGWQMTIIGTLTLKFLADFPENTRNKQE
jgi:hypothetical protein